MNPVVRTNNYKYISVKVPSKITIAQFMYWVIENVPRASAILTAAEVASNGSPSGFGCFSAANRVLTSAKAEGRFVMILVEQNRVFQKLY